MAQSAPERKRHGGQRRFKRRQRPIPSYRLLSLETRTPVVVTPKCDHCGDRSDKILSMAMATKAVVEGLAFVRHGCIFSFCGNPQVRRVSAVKDSELQYNPPLHEAHHVHHIWVERWLSCGGGA